MVFQTRPDKPVYGGAAYDGGFGGGVGGRVHVRVASAAGNARAEPDSVVLEEDEVAAEAYERALVGVLELDSRLVGLRRRFHVVVQLDAFHEETVLESDEQERGDVYPGGGPVVAREHGAQADFVLVEVPVVQFLVHGVGRICLHVVLGVVVRQFSQKAES